MPVNFGNLIRVFKVIPTNVINDVRRFCFGGALSPSMFFKKVLFLLEFCFGKKLSFVVMRFLL